jgi:hypothetical protein
MAAQVPPPPSRAQWKAQQAQWKMQRKMARARYRGMARGSLLGPILLIAIGVVALLDRMNRINMLHFWAWYGHWWPLLLIFAGVLLALESVAFARYSRIRLGGGIILLLIVFAILGVAASHNRLAWDWSAVSNQLDLGDSGGLAQVFGEKHQANETVTQALVPGTALILQNAHGDVTVSVEPADAADGKLHLTMQKTVFSQSNGDAERRLKALEPLITTSGGVMTVHMPTGDNATADMQLLLPADSPVEVHAGHGDVSVNGTHANVTVDADHGDVQLASIAGAVHATMREGDFSAREITGNVTANGHMTDVTASHITGTATLDGEFFGDVHLDNVSSTVHLHSSRTDIQAAQLSGTVTLDDDDLTVDGASGPVTVATTAKDISLRHVTGDMRVSNANGSIEINAIAPVGTISAENREGSVELTVPSDAKFSVEATAVDGEVHSGFPLATQNGNSHSIVSGSINGGGPLVHITTEKGDISLLKAN